jgi:sulfur carrier protein
MITINGNHFQEREIVLTNFLKNNHYDATKIAVEKNGLIVPRKEYDSAVFIAGDVIEIVQFVGGG